jgi:two-component system cell cycle sensor histidine kinase/response regulator CckA
VRIATGGTATPPERFRLVRADGGVLFAEIIGLPIVFEGEPSVLALVRDLTERHRLETEIRARDRLASVGRLAAAIGHEINNPLAYVMCNIEVALRKLDSAREADRAAVRRLLTEAGEGAERIRRIVRDLRTFSQSDRDETGPVDVARVLDSCIAMAAHEIRHRARVRKGYGALPPVLGNDARLGQVFLNLLINAAQAIPEGRADDNEIAIDARPEGDAVVITVRDTGTGIDPAARDRLFEPFFTTKPPESGTGLGLSICRSIVSSVGGSIRLEPGPRCGTIATVVLPCASRSSREPCESAAPPRQARACRVLVVDDEPQVAKAVAALLPPEAEAVVATTGEAALERLEGGEVFDIVLCDVMMPAMSGMDVYERARRTRPGVERRFVFMTGGTFTARSAQFLASVPNARLDKPFSAAQLGEALARVLEAEGVRG